MIYRSNLTCPDLTPHFKHLHSRPMGHSFGHDVPSDWADKADDDPMFGLYKQCGMWTHDEAAILYHVAKEVGGDWCDIGCHTGWTTIHIAAGVVASGRILKWGGIWAVDPMLAVDEFDERRYQSIVYGIDNIGVAKTSLEFFSELGRHVRFDGFVVDGDHQPGKPLEDARNAVKHLRHDGVILFHDFMGQPVRDAVRYLIAEHGMLCRVYLTPHCVAVCWFPPDDESERAGEGFVPAYHIPDPNLVMENLPTRWTEMNWKGYL